MTVSLYIRLYLKAYCTFYYCKRQNDDYVIKKCWIWQDRFVNDLVLVSAPSKHLNV